jgi:hypothetical protein
LVFHPSHSNCLKERDACTFLLPCFSHIPQPTAIWLPPPLNYLCQGHLFLNLGTFPGFLFLNHSEVFGSAGCYLFLLIWLQWFYSLWLALILTIQPLLLWLLSFQLLKYCCSHCSILFSSLITYSLIYFIHSQGFDSSLNYDHQNLHLQLSCFFWVQGIIICLCTGYFFFDALQAAQTQHIKNETLLSSPSNIFSILENGSIPYHTLKQKVRSVLCSYTSVHLIRHQSYQSEHPTPLWYIPKPVSISTSQLKPSSFLLQFSL